MQTVVLIMVIPNPQVDVLSSRKYGCIGYCKILSQRHPNMQLLWLSTRMVFLVPIHRLIVRQSSIGHPILSLLYGNLPPSLSRAKLPPNTTPQVTKAKVKKG